MFSVFSRRSPFRTRGASWSNPVVVIPPPDGGGEETNYRYITASDGSPLMTSDGFRIAWTPAAV